MKFGKWATCKISNLFSFLATLNLAIIHHICVSFINTCLTQMSDIWAKLVFVTSSAHSYLLLEKQGIRSKGWRDRIKKHLGSLQWGEKGPEMVEERKKSRNVWIAGVIPQGRVFLLLSLEQVRAGEAFSTMFTFEENDWKRFTGLSLGHPNTSPTDWEERKWKSVWNRNVYFCLTPISSVRKLAFLLLSM